MVPSITPWMPSVWLPEVSWSAAKTSTVTAPPVASLTIWPKSRPMSAQQVFSVAEQVYFQVIFSNWGASLPPSAAGASLLAGVLAGAAVAAAGGQGEAHGQCHEQCKKLFHLFSSSK